MPNITGRSGNTTNVYLNRDPIEATLPVQAIQTTVNDPIIISLKGLSGIGASNANKVIKVNSTGDSLIYDDESGSNWTLSGSGLNSNLYPLSTYTNVLIGTTTNPNSHGMFLLDKELAIKTTSGGFTYYGLKIMYGSYTVNNYVNNNGNMLWEGAQTNYNFDKPLIINTQGNGSELSNGTNTYTLPTFSGGTLALTTQIPSSNAQLSNGAGYITASSTDTLTNKSISYSQITGTPTLYWSLTNNALIPTNDNYFIQIQKLTDSTFETLLEFYNINSATDYQYFRYSMNDNGTTSKLKFDSERNSTISNVYEITNEGYMTFTKAIEIKDTNFQFIAPNGDNFNFPTTTPKSGILATRGDTISALNGGTGLTSLTANKILQVNSSSNGYNLVDIPGAVWTSSGSNIYTIGGGNVLIGITFNPNARTLYVNGDAQFTGTTFVEEILNVGTSSGSQAEINLARGNVGAKFEITSNSNLLISNSNYSSSNIVIEAGNKIDITGNTSIDGNLDLTGKIQTNTIEGVNNTSNTIVSNSSYGWEFRGTGSRYNISFPGAYYFPFLGTESANVFFIHINNIGDAYQISGTNSSNLQHLFLGKTVINKELVANVDNASSNGRIGFQNYLAGYTGSIYPVLISEQTYGYLMSATTPITGTGGSYDGYWGNGGVGNTSDRRLKKNINTIENPIDIIKKLRGVNFEWICENKPKGIQIGYIAQEVNEIIPSICDFLPTKNECCEDGIWGVQTANISAILVEGIKAQQEEINTLKTELDTYKSLMNKLINAKSFADFKKQI